MLLSTSILLNVHNDKNEGWQGKILEDRFFTGGFDGLDLHQRNIHADLLYINTQHS